MYNPFYWRTTFTWAPWVPFPGVDPYWCNVLTIPEQIEYLCNVISEMQKEIDELKGGRSHEGS